MSIFKDVTNTVKNIFNADDMMYGDEEPDFEETSEKKVSLPKIQFAKKETSTPVFDMNNHGFNVSSNDDSKKQKKSGRIQVYVPRTFEEAFNIVKDVKNGLTAMVNVEIANPQISQRIIDVISGAIYALGGECKKMGEKQYIFTLSTETVGAQDFLPVNGVMPQNNAEQYNFNMNQQQYDFVGQQMQQAFQNMNYANQQNFGNQNGQQQFNFGQQPNFNQQAGFNQQSAFNQQQSFNQQGNQDLKSFYVPPQSQF